MQFTIQQTIHFGMILQGVTDWNLRKAEVPESVSNQENLLLHYPNHSVTWTNRRYWKILLSCLEKLTE